MFNKDSIWWNAKKVGTLEHVSHLDPTQTTKIYTLVKNQEGYTSTYNKPSWQVEADSGSFRSNIFSSSTDLDHIDSGFNWFTDGYIDVMTNGVAQYFVGISKFVVFFCVFFLFCFFLRMLLIFWDVVFTSFLLILVCCSLLNFICLFVCVCILFYISSFFVDSCVYTFLLEEPFFQSVFESTRLFWDSDFEVFTTYYENDYTGSDFESVVSLHNESRLNSVKNTFSFNETSSLSSSDLVRLERDFKVDRYDRSSCFNLLLDLYNNKYSNVNYCGEYKDMLRRQKYFPLWFDNTHINTLQIDRIIGQSSQFIPTVSHRGIITNMDADIRFVLFNSLLQLSGYQFNIYSTIFYKYCLYNIFTSSLFVNLCHGCCKTDFLYLISLLHEMFKLMGDLNIGSCVAQCYPSYIDTTSYNIMLPSINLCKLDTLTLKYLSISVEDDPGSVFMCTSYCRSYIHSLIFNLPVIHDYYKICHFNVSRIALEDYGLPIYRIALANFKDSFPILYTNIKALSSTPFGEYLGFIFSKDTWFEQIDLRMLLRSPFFIDCVIHQDTRHNYLFLCWLKKLLFELDRDLFIGHSFFYSSDYAVLLSQFVKNCRYNVSLGTDVYSFLFPSIDLQNSMLFGRQEYEYYFLEYNNLLYTGYSYDYYHNLLPNRFFKYICYYGMDKNYLVC